MNCYHRSYINCSCRKFLRFRMVSKLTRFSGANRRDQHGNAAAPRSQQSPVVPPPGPQPGPSGPSPPSLPSRRGSVAMTDAPPLNFPAGVTTTRSRSEYIREPNVDFSNPEVAERVARMHEQRAADIRAGRITQGSPSTGSESSSTAIQGPSRRTPRSRPREASVEEEDEGESSPSPAQRSGRGVQVRRTEGGGTHTRFPS